MQVAKAELKQIAKSGPKQAAVTRLGISGLAGAKQKQTGVKELKQVASGELKHGSSPIWR